jgi:hypothetical protein
MTRFGLATLLALTLLGGVRGDAFDNYTAAVIAKAPGADGVKEIAELTPDLILANDEVLPNLKGALIVVYTNDARWAKLLVTAAAQKLQTGPGSRAETVPVLRIDRFVTFREASERAVKASGQAVSVFPGFQFHLDLGQVIPAKYAGDLSVTEVSQRAISVKPEGKAKMYLVTKPLAAAAAKPDQKLEFGGKFEPKYLNGTFKLFDDGRRGGTLRLKVDDNGDVTGTLVSDLDGREYEVRGSVGKPNHKILFTVQFPQTQQQYEGMMFTGNGKAIAGTSKLQEKEAAFYATRVHE